MKMTCINKPAQITLNIATKTKCVRDLVIVFENPSIEPFFAVDPFSFLAHQYDLINEQQANEEEMQRPTRYIS